MLTIVSSYFNDSKLLTEWWFPAMDKHKDVEFIIVDDFSQSNRAEDCWQDKPNAKLFYITEDKKFNSHGARNLGVSQSANQFVFMTDIDALPIDPLIKKMQKVQGNRLYWPQWHHEKPSKYAGTPCPNEFSVLKDQFIAIKGYDEEVAQHGGWFGDWWTRRNYINTYNPEIMRYGACWFLEEDNGDRKDHKIRDRELEARIKLIVDDRNTRRDYDNKPWLNFKWEQVR